MENPLRKTRGRVPVWAIGVVFALLAGLGAPLTQSAGILWAQTGSSSASSLTYTVRPGDSWGIVAERLGVSVDALRQANSDRIRDTDWLIEGEQLIIPVAADIPLREHEVQVGESWNSIAARYNVPVGLLQAANPRSVRAGMLLYRGERLIIPPPPRTAVAEPADSDADADADGDVAESPAPGTTATVTDSTGVTLSMEIPHSFVTTTPVPATEPAAEPEAAATVTPRPTPPATTTAEVEEAEEEDAEASEAVSIATETSATETSAVELPACPARFLDFPQAMTAAINADPSAGPANLRAFLEGCEALVDGGFVAQDLTDNAVDDVVVIYRNPAVDSIFIESDLAIFNGDADSYTLVYRARAAGDVYLLTVDDINLDDQVDVVWIDTTCGASTCFDTVNVRTWTGDAWADWTEGTITMAYAAITLTDVADLDLPAGAADTAPNTVTGTDAGADTPQGQAIVLQGGIYGSVGAGPQRSRVEVWGSLGGAPYSLIEREYIASECLYHVVIDANAALLNGWDDDFAAAETLYTQAVSDTSLIKCWVRPDEEDELRSLSLFRLALIAGYQEDATLAAERAQAVIDAYPDEAYEAVAAIWLREYRTSGSAAEACQVVTLFAELTPDTWELLADYGYTNPGFEAADVCPVLAPPDPDAHAEQGEDDERDETDENDETAGAPEGALATFPECPADLSGYPAALAGVLTFAGGDEALIEAWLTSCRAMNETRGAFVLTDITGNGARDAAFFPVLITDLGFGPGGAQGTTLIYHAEPDGSYTLAANPEIYGQPEPLAIADLNDNGQIEVAWTVTGCSTFCVTEVQMWTWDGSAYTPAIFPGATMANAEVSFEPVTPPVAAATSTGEQRLVLYGGISGTIDGGLETPHWEEWQSIDGGPYQRVRWEYDRAVSGNECLGLRLIEADVALQAAGQIGYATALELYANALADLAADELTACSIMGMAENTELDLLQGLATFRLIQVYALAGDGESAAAILTDFEADGPQTDYVTVARAWWDAFSAALDAGGNQVAEAAELACADVLPIFEDNPELWQVTDQYGYNHPVLAAEQICFAP